ncbi:MAG: hypothetical protein ORN53_00870, partial [Crocinitomicaceae bacterium]|nr:hypothetical protein [Crocinitomicaceae bacterium]
SSKLEDINSIDALPKLIELLEISYLREYNKDSFNRLHSDLIHSFNNLAMNSEKNLEIVTQALRGFADKNAKLFEDVRLLHFNIESMKDQYYSNHVQTYSLEQIKRKLEQLGQG